MKQFSAVVLNKYAAEFEQCEGCGYLRARDPFWLDEAYSSAIAASDTGLVMRNISVALKLTSVLFLLFEERGAGRYVDVAGGYGMLTRLMRDFGFDFYWSDKYCQNLLAQGFDFASDITPSVAVTAIEVMEHCVDPMGFVKDALERTGAETFVFTTELFEGAAPPLSWWYYSFPTGQHIGFFQRQTLEQMANKLGLRYVSANGVHVFTRRKISDLALKCATHSLTTKLLPWMVRKRLGSRTVSDNLLLLKNYGRASPEV